MSTYLKNKGGAGGTFHEVDTGRMFKVNEHQQDKVKKPCVISCINRFPVDNSTPLVTITNYVLPVPHAHCYLQTHCR